MQVQYLTDTLLINFILINLIYFFYIQITILTILALHILNNNSRINSGIEVLNLFLKKPTLRIAVIWMSRLPIALPIAIANDPA